MTVACHHAFSSLYVPHPARSPRRRSFEWEEGGAVEVEAARRQKGSRRKRRAVVQDGNHSKGRGPQHRVVAAAQGDGGSTG